jgi:hypothetical protein
MKGGRDEGRKGGRDEGMKGRRDEGTKGGREEGRKGGSGDEHRVEARGSSFINREIGDYLMLAVICAATLVHACGIRHFLRDDTFFSVILNLPGAVCVIALLPITYQSS